ADGAVEHGVGQPLAEREAGPDQLRQPPGVLHGAQGARLLLRGELLLVLLELHLRHRRGVRGHLVVPELVDSVDAALVDEADRHPVLAASSSARSRPAREESSTWADAGWATSVRSRRFTSLRTWPAMLFSYSACCDS